MHYKLILFFCFFSTTILSQQITIDVKNMPLIDIINQLEKENDLLFSYVNKDIEGLKTSIQTFKEPLNSFLHKLLDNRNLSFKIESGNYIILTKKATLKIPDKSTNIRGQVLDKLTQSPLPFSNVYIKKSLQGVYADEAGKFDFSAILNKNDTLVISNIGYKEQEFLAIDFAKSKDNLVILDFLEFAEDFIVVKDYLTDGIELGDNGASTIIRLNRTGAMPGEVEPDVLKTIQFLPGISSPDNTSAGIYIRGGTPDQNLVLWDDIPIYHSAHYFGLISAFNPYIIDKAKVYRSGFSVKYGGRLSGIIDLETNEKITDKFSGGIGTNMTHTYIYGKIPLQKNKTKATFSLRRSLTDFWTSPTYKNLTNKALQAISLGQFNSISEIKDIPHVNFHNNFYFIDSNVNIKTKIDDKNELSISGLYAQNEFLNIFNDNKETDAPLKQVDSFYLVNQGLNVNFKHNWSPNFSSQIKGMFSNYNYNYKHTQFRASFNPNPSTPPTRELNDTITKFSSIYDKQFHIANSFKTSKNNLINFGYQYTNYQVKSLYEDNRNDNNTPSSPDASPRNNANENINKKEDLHTLYSEFSFSKGKKLSANIGLRYNYYSGKKQFYFEPRLSVNYKLTDYLDLQANAGRYHQFLNGIVKNTPRKGTLINNPIWTIANEKSGFATNSNQFQLGFLYHKNDWIIDVQGYYKNTYNIATNSIGFDLLPQEGMDLGESKIIGMDVLLKKRWKNYRSWLSYSLGDVDYIFNKISNQSFASPFDTRHEMKWAHLYSFKNWDFALGWNLVSGRPYTIIEDFTVNPPTSINPQEEIIPVYGKINANYLDFQHHLDLSISYSFIPKSKSDWKTTIGFSIYNIYNKENIYYTSYYIDDTSRPYKIKQNQQNSLPFTPNIVFRVEIK